MAMDSKFTIGPDQAFSSRLIFGLIFELLLRAEFIVVCRRRCRCAIKLMA